MATGRAQLNPEDYQDELNAYKVIPEVLELVKTELNISYETLAQRMGLTMYQLNLVLAGDFTHGMQDNTLNKVVDFLSAVQRAKKAT